jgi:hypothetical protein
LKRLVSEQDVDGVVWVPHSIPRKVPFLPELRRLLALNKPEIAVVKTYVNGIPVIDQQQIPYQRVLLIDDAVGSGATLNEIARKLKQNHHVKTVYGFSVVGSYKGFDILSEV